MIELRHLRYFVAVAEELHFSRAAEKLQMAQPPLSQQIRQLEAHLGVTLLLRGRRTVGLTEAGRVFLDEARRTLRQADVAVQAAREAGRGNLGRLNVSFVTSAPFNVLPPILRAFRERHGGVDLALHEASSAEQGEALLDGRFDVGFVRLPLEAPGIAREVILRETLVAALPEGHPLAAARRVDLGRLAGEPFILVPRAVTPGFHDLVIRACGEAGFSPTVTQEASQMQTIIGLVGAGLGVSLVPESVQELHGTGVVFRPLRVTGPQVELAVAWREGNPSRLLANFLAVAREASR